MDIKNKISNFIECGNKIAANSKENGITKKMSGQLYEQWMNEIETFSQRFLASHPIKSSIHSTYFLRSSRGSFEQMMGYLRALESDEDVLYEQVALPSKKKKLLVQNDLLTVLFFASNPQGVKQLSIDQEARMIEEAIRKSEYRDKVNFISKWAIQTTDILQGINEINPNIIHFSGHGTENNELVLQNSDGSPKKIKKEAISQVISTVSDKVKLVFFNSCFSSGQAEEVVKHIDSAIGMSDSIGDKTACIFTAQFYSSLGFGLSLQKAFDQAIALLMMEGIHEEKTPCLHVKYGLNSQNIKLVKSNPT